MIALYNGRIYTQDQQRPMVQALLTQGEYIVRIGSDKEILDCAPASCEKIDLRQRAVVPGFIDSHFHLFDWALDYGSLDLAACNSLAQLQEQLHAAGADSGEWLLGHGFDHSEWPEGRLPNRHDLDQVVAHRPVCLWRCDLHTAVANSRALVLAGIDANRSDPEAGTIEREISGKPSGVLRETAPNLIRRVLPEPTTEKVQANLCACIRRLHALGITGVHDARLMAAVNGTQALQQFRQLHEQRQLELRVQVAIPGEYIDEAIKLGLRSGWGDDRLCIGALKFFADGGMGSRTAWMVEPYRDAGSGTPLTPITDIREAVVKADAAGLSVMVHAIGDRANKELIAMFDDLAPFAPPLPHRIEHAQMVQPADVSCLGNIPGLAISCQPNNLSLDVSMIETSVAERSRFAYPLRDLLDAGVLLMFSSDAPVCDPAPLAGIYSAVTRKRMDGTPVAGWYPQQRVTVAEAVRAYTATPAAASGFGSRVGRLKAGYYADLVVMNQDIYRIAADSIAATQVDMTLFSGQIVHRISA